MLSPSCATSALELQPPLGCALQSTAEGFAETERLQRSLMLQTWSMTCCRPPQADRMQWWRAVVQGEPEIDTQKVRSATMRAHMIACRVAGPLATGHGHA